MKKWLRSSYLLCCYLLSLAVQAETCPQIWTSAVQGSSAVPASVSYSPSSPTSINSLNTTLAAADYQLTNSTVANNTTLTASGPTVRIFFNGSLSIGNNVRLNALGNAENLLIVATGSIAIGNNTVIKGFILAGGSVQVGTGSQVTGAITAKGSAANFGTVSMTRPHCLCYKAGWFVEPLWNVLMILSKMLHYRIHGLLAAVVALSPLLQLMGACD